MGRNALWLLGSRVAADLLSFVLFLAVSRRFGPEGAGVYAYGFAIAALIHSAATLGIDEYGIREYTRSPRSGHEKLISELLGAQLSIATVAVVLLAIFLFLTRPSTATLFIVLSLTVYQLCVAVANTYFVPAMAEQHMRVPAVSSLVCRAFAAVIAIVLLAIGATLMASLSVFAAAGVLMLTLSIVSARGFGVRGRPRVSMTALRSGARTLWSFAAVEVIAQLFTRIGVIVLSLRVTEAAAGIYATGLKLVEVACLPMIFGGIAAYPRLCKAFREPATFARLSRWTIAWGSAITVMCALAMFLGVPLLLVPLLGERFAGAEPILAAMSAIVLVQGIEIVLGRLLLAANLNVVRAAWVTVAGLACAVATLMVAPMIGIVGAVASVVAAYLLLDLLYAYSLLGMRRRVLASAAVPARTGGAGTP
jgi:O-antigen/teichoic acid export membrane protein